MKTRSNIPSISNVLTKVESQFNDRYKQLTFSTNDYNLHYYDNLLCLINRVPILFRVTPSTTYVINS